MSGLSPGCTGNRRVVVWSHHEHKKFTLRIQDHVKHVAVFTFTFPNMVVPRRGLCQLISTLMNLCANLFTNFKTFKAQWTNWFIVKVIVSSQNLAQQVQDHSWKVDQLSKIYLKPALTISGGNFEDAFVKAPALLEAGKHELFSLASVLWDYRESWAQLQTVHPQPGVHSSTQETTDGSPDHHNCKPSAAAKHTEN